MLLIALAFLLILSALFAGAETSLFLVARNKDTIQRERSRSGGDSVILKIIGQPNRLLMTILLGNLLVNMAFFSLSSVYVFRLEEKSVGMGVVASVGFLILVLVSGEVVPKTLAASVPYFFSRVVAPCMDKAMTLLAPLIRLLEKVVTGFNRLIGMGNTPDSTVDDAHLRQMVDINEEIGAVGTFSAEILSKLIGLRDIRLKEMIIPRVDVWSCCLTDSVAEVVSQASQWGVTIVPLYSDNYEDIDHYVDCLDLLGVQEDSSVSQYAQKIQYLPELATMDKVHREFLEDTLQVALVVDEFGDMVGIVRRDIVLQSLLTHLEAFSQNKKSSFEVISGRAPIRPYLLEGEESEFVTVSGYLTSMWGRVPQEGEDIFLENTRFVVMRADTTKILQVLVQSKD